jgi:hypothetical protein
MSFGATWTYDAGSGIDDSLVLVSEQGELLIYQGTDPSNATNFSLKGLWFIGQVPVGRRGYCAHGGDLLILCTYGLVGMADIVAGRVSTAGESIASGIGFKVNQELAARISDQIGDYYWHLTVYPSEAIIVLGTPIYSPSLSTYLELAMNSITNAWCTMTGMDILCATIWQGQFIFGTHDGGVKWGFHGFQDNTDIANIQNGDDITGRFQNSFNDFDSPNDNKRMQRIKVYGLLERTIPTFYARFQPEYAIGDDISAPSLVATSVPFWDRAKWDEATWSIGAGSFRQWFGVNGFGKKMSLQLALRGAGKVLMTDYEVLYETGIGL